MKPSSKKLIDILHIRKYEHWFKSSLQSKDYLMRLQSLKSRVARQVFLFHYAQFEPLWEYDGLIQCGPNISSESSGVQVKQSNICNLQNSLRAKGLSTSGVLVHYTDPFIIKAGVLRGLSRWKGPKLLVCGDLHHGDSPIDTLKEYQSKEFHDCILLAFNPILLQEVQAKLNVPVSCYPPGFFRYPQREYNPLAQKSLLHIGSIGPHHVRRREIIQSLLKRQRIPFFHTMTKSSEDAADLYNSHALALNIPLNNDLNHRFFEVISAGTTQIMFGEKELLGNLQHFATTPGIYWVNSVAELENLVLKLLNNPTIIKSPIQHVKYHSIKELLDKCFYP